MKRFLPSSNAPWMSPGIFAASVRRPLAILPFLAPALCKPWTAQNMVRCISKITVPPKPATAGRLKSAIPKPKPTAASSKSAPQKQKLRPKVRKSATPKPKPTAASSKPAPPKRKLKPKVKKSAIPKPKPTAASSKSAPPKQKLKSKVRKSATPKSKPAAASSKSAPPKQKLRPKARAVLSGYASEVLESELRLKPRPRPRAVLSGYAPKILGSELRVNLKTRLGLGLWSGPRPRSVVRLIARKKWMVWKSCKLKPKPKPVWHGPLVRWLILENKQRSHIKSASVQWVHKKTLKPQMVGWIDKRVLASIRCGAVSKGHYLKYLEGSGNPGVQDEENKILKTLEESRADEVVEEDEDVVENQLLERNGNSDLQDKKKNESSIFEPWIGDEMPEWGVGNGSGGQMLYTVSGVFESYAKRKLRGILTKILSKGKDSKSMAKMWSTLDQKERRHGFRYIAGHLLRRKHTKFCMRLLECCCLHNPYPPTPEDVALVLEYITQWELRKHRNMYMRRKATIWQEQKEEHATRLINLVLALLRVDYGGAFPLKQSTIHRLTRSSCLEDVSRLYDSLQEAKIVLTTDTMLHFVNRLSDPITWTKAHSIMELLSRDWSRSLHSPQMWKAFQTLFYNATFIGEEESSAVVRMMLCCNINPGPSSYNILLTKASRNQDEQSLMRIFRQMLESGLRPSMVTYGLLHKHYKRQGAETERFQVLRDAMKLDSNLNVILATDIVHAKVATSSSYLPVLDEYLDFFTPAPLVSLGIATPEHNVILINSTQRARFEPDHMTIAIMIHAFCMYEQDPMIVWAAYQRYQRILKTEKSRERLDPLYEAGPYIPNAYMLALGCHEETLWHCATILEDMLKPGSPIQANVYSWSILLHAMSKAQKMEQAEQVLGAMRRKDIEPNAVTWTSLMTGYVRIGRLWQAGEVMRRMTAENVEPNYATMGVLASIIDSKELMKGIMGGDNR